MFDGSYVPVKLTASTHGHRIHQRLATTTLVDFTDFTKANTNYSSTFQLPINSLIIWFPTSHLSIFSFPRGDGSPNRPLVSPVHVIVREYFVLYESVSVFVGAVALGRRRHDGDGRLPPLPVTAVGGLAERGLNAGGLAEGHMAAVLEVDHSTVPATGPGPQGLLCGLFRGDVVGK